MAACTLDRMGSTPVGPPGLAVSGHLAASLRATISWVVAPSRGRLQSMRAFATKGARQLQAPAAVDIGDGHRGAYPQVVRRSDPSSGIAWQDRSHVGRRASGPRATFRWAVGARRRGDGPEPGRATGRGTCRSRSEAWARDLVP